MQITFLRASIFCATVKSRDSTKLILFLFRNEKEFRQFEFLEISVIFVILQFRRFAKYGISSISNFKNFFLPFLRESNKNPISIVSWQKNWEKKRKNITSFFWWYDVKNFYFDQVIIFFCFIWKYSLVLLNRFIKQALWSSTALRNHNRIVFKEMS